MAEGEQLKWTVPLNGSGATASAFTFLQEGLLFSIRVIPSSGTPTVTLRNGNDVVIDGRQFSGDTTAYPQAPTEAPDGTATGLYMPFLFVGNTSVTITGGANDGSVDIICKMYP